MMLRVCEYSGLAAAMFRFRCRTTSASFGLEFIGLADIENLEIAFRISRLSIIERDIRILPVWRRHLLFPLSDDVGGCWTWVYRSGRHRKFKITFRISFLSAIEREIQVLPVWRPPSCVSGDGRCRDVIKYSGLRFGEVFQS
jgi:hypothetical protein